MPKTIPDDVVWQPQPGSQAAFLSVPHQEIFEVLYEGTRGPGKTDALLMDFAQHVGQGYGAAWKGVLFRRTYPELGDVISKSEKWFPLIWPKARFNKGGNFWEWPSGEKLLFRHFNTEDDYKKYHGHEYPWIAWEELTNWPDDVGYTRMMSLCRSSTRGMPRKYRATTNPYGPGHNWVKHRFKLRGVPRLGPGPILQMRDKDGNYLHNAVSIHGDITENKIMLEADPGYIARIRASASNPAEMEAWLKGNWDVVAGGMFDDLWDPRVHIVPNFIVPASWMINRSFDWGSSRPFSVGWWAESDGTDLKLPDGTTMATVRGDLFRIGEWYGWTGKPNEGLRMIASEIARGIVERELTLGIYGKVETGPADSSIFTEENGDSVANGFMQEIVIGGRRYPGIYWVPADKSPGSRILGWQAIRERMENSKTTTRDGRVSPREKPGLFVCQRCEDGFIRTVPKLPRDRRKPDDVHTEAEDHVGDETRYRIHSAVQQNSSGYNRVVGGY